MDRAASGPVFNGTRASYVALCCTAVLVLTTLQWAPTDGGGGSAVAVLGLLAVYVGSTECLALFYSLALLSAFLDLWRLGGPREPHVRGRGLLILLQLLATAAKVAGALLGWSLQKSAAAGEGASGHAGSSFGGGPSFNRGAGANVPAAAYARVDDPFSLPPLPPVPAPAEQQQAPPVAALPVHYHQQQQQQPVLPPSVAGGDQQQKPPGQGPELL